MSVCEEPEPNWKEMGDGISKGEILLITALCFTKLTTSIQTGLIPTSHMVDCKHPPTTSLWVLAAF